MSEGELLQMEKARRLDIREDSGRLNAALSEILRALLAEDGHDVDAAVMAKHGIAPIDLVVNTSCEHIPDVRAWPRLHPPTSCRLGRVLRDSDGARDRP